MLSNEVQILIVMTLYLTGLIAWGVYQGRKVKTSTDFSIGGRKLPGWVAALSERATGESSWALLGLPGLAYASGLMSIWTAVGCVLGIIVSWSLLAWKMQQEAQKYDAQTYVDYLSKKQSDQEQAVRIVSSLVIVFFFFFYVGAQFIGGGKTLYSMFGIDPIIGIVITAFIIVPYTIFGGFRSVVYTDVIQAIVMITTLVIGPIVGLIYISTHPGEVYATDVITALKSAGDKYTSLVKTAEGFQFGVIIGGLSWFFGYLGGMPQLITRFMAIRDRQQAKVARNVGIAWTIVAYAGALTLGWIGLAIFGPEGLKDQEYVMPMVILKIFPPIIAGILITGAIAAMISTADSLLILSSTELSENIVARKITDKKKKLMISRIITAILALIALGLAIWSQKSEMISNLVFDIVGYVWAGIGGTFSVVVLLSLFWKKFGGTATTITIIFGMAFTIFWILSGLEEKIVTARLMTFVVTFVFALLMGLIFPKRETVKEK